MKKEMFHVIRQTLRSAYLSMMGTFAKPAVGIHIISGHRIEDELEPETFRKLLSKLSKYVKFIRIEEAITMIVNKVEPKEPLVAFAYDDGFMECYDVFAPVLEEFGVNAIFFVNPNYVEGDDEYIDNFNKNIVLTPGRRPMRWEQIKELSDRGFLIGAHTMDHYMINSDDTEILEYQINTCKGIIEKHTGKPCDYFAFPYGKLTHANNKSIDIACQYYKYVFSQSDYKRYFSFNNRVINRRHYEVFWPISHVKYFLSCTKKW